MCIWLLECHYFIEVPKNVDVYLASQFCRRKTLFKHQSMANWVWFLEKCPLFVRQSAGGSVQCFVIQGHSSAYLCLLGFSSRTNFLPKMVNEVIWARANYPEDGLHPFKELEEQSHSRQVLGWIVVAPSNHYYATHSTLYICFEELLELDDLSMMPSQGKLFMKGRL